MCMGKNFLGVPSLLGFLELDDFQVSAKNVSIKEELWFDYKMYKSQLIKALKFNCSAESGNWCISKYMSIFWSQLHYFPRLMSQNAVLDLGL